MQNIQQDNERVPTLIRNWSVSRVGRMLTPKTLTIHIPRRVPLFVGVLVLVALVCSDWTVQAATPVRPVLDLKLAGPQTAQVGQPLIGINVSIINPGPSAQNARLRLIIHDGTDRDLKADDIKIDVREGTSWVPVPLEPVDGGLMGAIGTEGSGHRERHRRGGFTIPANLNKFWQLRITFSLPGVYQLVGTVSPDNGNTHLTQPSFITLEAL